MAPVRVDWPDPAKGLEVVAAAAAADDSFGALTWLVLSSDNNS